MDKFTPWIALAGRVLLALMFVLAGYDKIGGFEGTQQFMASAGVPGALLPLVILAELGGGLAIVFGFLTRTASIGLAVFTVLAAVIFHADFNDYTQQLLFMKNLSIAGGLLILAASGSGRLSIDSTLGRHW